MQAAGEFRQKVQSIIDDPATGDALRTYAMSALNRDPVDVLVELDVLQSVFQERVNGLLPSLGR